MTTVMVPTSAGIDRARPHDRVALERLFAACSPQTIFGRFFAPLSTFPARYLNGVLADEPAVHDAVVVRYGDGLHIAGLASFVGCDGAAGSGGELAVLVRDGWQGYGLGRAMVRTLVNRAVERGADELTTSVLPGRSTLLLALARHLELVTVSADADGLTGQYRLPPAGWP
jgi:GNAT superfamily N-acetyltransferase